MMFPVVAIIGKPNTGKSTLFNRICKSHRALVDDLPGVTRDLLFKDVIFNNKPFTVVDTGGLQAGRNDSLTEKVAEQIEIALDLADAVILVLDGQKELTVEDYEAVTLLRKKGVRTFAAINKIDGARHEINVTDFYRLGFEKLYSISAREKIGINDLLDDVIQTFPEIEEPNPENDAQKHFENPPIRIAFLGRPNVGKSTLVNRILGHERMIVSEIPGTTRDSVDTLFESKGKEYVLVDTAGIRRKSRIDKRIEIFSVLAAFRALQSADVALVLIDANEMITDQDLRIARMAVEKGKGLILLCNKVDAVKDYKSWHTKFKDAADLWLSGFLFAPILEISAKTGKGIEGILPAVERVAKSCAFQVPTSKLNDIIHKALEAHVPPSIDGRPFNIYYATQIGNNPPTFVAYANRVAKIHPSYQRYLINSIREAFRLTGTPIRLFFRKKK